MRGYGGDFRAAACGSGGSTGSGAGPGRNDTDAHKGEGYVEMRVDRRSHWASWRIEQFSPDICAGLLTDRFSTEM